ncbi:MAG: 5'-nucleotidase C-terminal domain-containing protein [Elainellaceae cyanobacterium]
MKIQTELYTVGASLDENVVATLKMSDTVTTQDDDDDDDDDNDDDDDDDGSGGTIIERDSTIFGFTTVFIEGRSTVVTTESTTLGSLTADANLFIARSMDASVTISITHAGAISSSIGYISDEGTLLPTQPNPDAGKQAGAISQLDIENSLQLNSGLVLLTLTREQLVQTIEHGVSATGDGTNPLQFPQVSGLLFSYDANLPPGQRVRSLAIKDDDGNITDILVKNGKFQATSGKGQQTYRIVTTNFLADGGDGYRFPDFGATSNRVNLTEVNADLAANIANFSAFGTEQDALAEYLAANYGTNPYSVQETTIDQDITIQNLTFRADTVVDINLNTFVLVGNGSKDKLLGGNLDDLIRGLGGNDRLICRGGDDQVMGNGGNDKISCGSGDDDADGNKGNDTIRGSKGDDTIDGNKGSDRLLGGGDDDELSGGDGEDFLNGGRGNDVLKGGDGDDILICRSGNNWFDGGNGDDLMVGGKGNDTFVISGSGTKTIRGFNRKGMDILRFDAYAYQELDIVQSGRDTLIQVDQNILAVLLKVQATAVDESVFNPSQPKEDLCDDLGKPQKLTFEYVPSTDLLTGQDPKKATVSGMPDDDELAYVAVSNRKRAADVRQGKGRTYFAGQVLEGDEFTADADIAGTRKFGSRTFIHLFEDEDAFLDGDAPLQTMQYHTSCSEPMQLGDIIGSVQLTAYVGESGMASTLL